MYVRVIAYLKSNYDDRTQTVDIIFLTDTYLRNDATVFLLFIKIYHMTK